MRLMIERIVKDLDDVVVRVTAGNEGWASTMKGDQAVRRELRSTLKNYGLPTVGGLFEKAFAYIAEHY